MQTQIPFAWAPDGSEPDKVPGKLLNTGARMPAIGLATFGSDHVPPPQVADAVEEAIALCSLYPLGLADVLTHPVCLPLEVCSKL